MSKLAMNLGFIGAGIMAQATAKALISSDLINPGSIYASAPSDNNLKWWKDAGANTTHDNGTILKKCKVIVLAMKPQYFEKALSTADKDFIQENETVFISLLAGINTSQLQKILNKHLNFKSNFNEQINVYHVIPNTAISIGYGCTVYCQSLSIINSHNVYCFIDNIPIVEKIFNSCGLCLEISEDILNAASAVSGSGIAYVYIMIEALSDGGVKMGIPRPLAMKLAAQTFLGGAKMIQETGKHPGQLKDEVCSAGGTTIAAVHAMEKNGIRGGLIDAVEAAVRRNQEISEKQSVKNVQ